jgi:LDH2 family malate/lactate/ureidoglycolate dehydrogenase
LCLSCLRCEVALDPTAKAGRFYEAFTFDSFRVRNGKLVGLEEAIQQLEDLVTAIFVHLQMPEAHARISARALVAADLRGHESHGVSNYIRTIYEPGLRQGLINTNPRIQIVYETPTTDRWNADGAMGHVAAEYAMRDCIERARRYGVGFAAVANSRHFGAAQIAALMALDHGMVGLSMTNGGALTVPFQGLEPKLGTNPIAVAIPAGQMPPFVLDMATTTVAWGKLANAARDDRSIPVGWALDSVGMPTSDPRAAMEASRLLPLGGTKEGGAHKGYGLATWVEIFCGLFSGTCTPVFPSGNVSRTGARTASRCIRPSSRCCASTQSARR